MNTLEQQAAGTIGPSAKAVELPPTIQAYVQAINDHDSAAFNALIADDAVVNDEGREFRGRAAIQAWSDREIFAASVTLEVLGAADRKSETVVTTKVDGNFDKTGLPDPVIINHYITVERAKIVALKCQLASEEPEDVVC